MYAQNKSCFVTFIIILDCWVIYPGVIWCSLKKKISCSGSAQCRAIHSILSCN